MTDKQVDKLATLARELGGGMVSVMFDLDREGDNGAKQAVLELASRCRVRYAWSSSLAFGRFVRIQPESLSREWEKEICPAFVHCW